MRRNSKSITSSQEIIKNIDALAQANFNLLTKLVPSLAEREKRQRKFAHCVLIQLSRIETLLTEIQGYQLAEFGSPGKLSDQKLTEYLKEVETRMELASGQQGLRMIRYIYGEDPAPEVRHNRRRRWWGWEI